MISIALLLTSFAFAKPQFPTPPVENETIEQSVGRLRHDEVMGSRRLRGEENQLKRLIGVDAFGKYEAGQCPKLECVPASRKRAAVPIAARIAELNRQVKDLKDQRKTLTGMMAKVNAPLQANKSVQPGVTQVAGSLTVSMPPASALLPATPAPAGSVPQTSPGQQLQPPTAPPPGQQTTPQAPGA